MQTFLPLPDFKASARCLDRLRLGKQRGEVEVILHALMGARAYRNHPATLMWDGFALALVAYGEAVCNEWINRGYRDNTLPKIRSIARELIADGAKLEYPSWLGNDRFHAAHRAALYRKSPIMYPKWAHDVCDPCCPGCNYYWPTHTADFGKQVQR